VLGLRGTGIVRGRAGEVVIKLINDLQINNVVWTISWSGDLQVYDSSHFVRNGKIKVS